MSSKSSMPSNPLSCRQCSAAFAVAPEDAEILKKLDCPEPQLCALCALQRRLAWRNERHLYRRTCELCHKNILAMYAPTSYAHVYCRSCWYSDKWDPASYGRDFDPARPFLDQFFELMAMVPHYNLWQIGTNENCEYANFIFNLKDSYLSFSTIEGEGAIYCKNVDYSRDCVDCYNVAKSELLYECVDTTESYHGAYLTRCTKCTDCYLCRDCQDCQDCFGGINLRHKQFCWYNEQLTEDEYRRRLAAAIKDRNSLVDHFSQLAQDNRRLPVEYATIRTSEEATGDYLRGVNRVRNSFDLYESENLGDCYRVVFGKEMFREAYNGWGELCYENISGPKRFGCVGTVFGDVLSFSAYCYSCAESQYLLGCVGLRKKKFCILNREYSEKEYYRRREQITAQMKEREEWGEFFSVARSPHAYNDTVAQEMFPLHKSEVLARGWTWNDDQGGTRGQETVKPADVPASVADVPETIIKEVLACIVCGLNYRIQRKELQILQSLHLALPVECVECRFKKRYARHNTPAAYLRQCMCEREHEWHGGHRCPHEFQTTYSTDRPEIVYCEQCYQAEVI